ncbi:MAG: penicillin-binding transpeptidase domain-containing protein [Gemmatimonadales bacterium]|nr:penicillin-binding transpeptidase domain-containing protein [Gemmatimonadales bacterium]
MARADARLTVLQVCFALAAAGVIARAAQLQLVEHAQWAEKAREARTAETVLPARRGTVRDRTGAPLAITREFYHLGITPREVADVPALLRAARPLALPAGQLARRLRRDEYVYLHGPFTATQVARLRPLRGVHLDLAFRREYPAGELARPVVGRVTPDSGAANAGIEAALDSVLRGAPGAEVQLRDGRGRRYVSPSRLVREPVAGCDVVLTLHAELQEIAERSLDEAIASLGAEGGDLVLYDPRRGELLAVASRRRGGVSSAAAFSDPDQPGSTAKLFTAAALLVHDRVRPDDAVSGENGKWVVPLRRGRWTLTDTHREEGPLTLARAIEVSSNIGMAKFAARLSDAEQFEMLRAFGFGTATGAEFPAESRGQLYPTTRWTEGFSRPSHAIGYEFSVTPVQLAAAYGAIAHDGVLLAPALVREVRCADGTVRYRHRPEPVRRVLPAAVAATLRGYLALAAGDSGTAARANLRTIPMAGKTGTARRNRGGAYQADAFVTWFAALFPANDPQLVAVVRIDAPTKGSRYAASTAAPLTREVLEQALAARSVPIDRARLASDTPAPAPADTPTVARAAAPDEGAEPAPPAVLALPLGPPPAADTATLAVPDVTGLPLRRAAYVLHSLGLEVMARGAGTVTALEPAAGARVRRGDLVTLATAP